MKKILLIDDDMINTKALAARLERRGYKTTIINDGSDILQHLSENEYDLILLDIIMPDLSGSEILEIIRSKYDKNQMPVIVVSSIDDSIDISESFNKGANDYLTKPVNLDVAEARMGAHIDSAQRQLSNINKKEVEAISAMIITYNHELNNPLAIALSTLELMQNKNEKNTETHEANLRDALRRIADIVKKIESLTMSNQLAYTDYVKNKKMIRLD